MYLINLKNFFFGASSQVLGNILIIFQKILIVPLFLKFWGEETYKDWLIILTFASYFSLLDLGSQPAIANKIQKLLKENKKNLNIFFNTSLNFFILLPAFSFLLFFLICQIFDFTNFLKVEEISNKNIILILFVLNTLISVPISILISIYRSYDKFVRGSLIANLILFFQIILHILLIVYSNPLNLIISLNICSIIFLIYLILDFSKISNQKIKFKVFSFGSLLIVLKSSFDFFLQQISLMITNQGIFIALSSIYKTLDVLIYSSVRTLTNFSKQINAITFHASWHDISNIFFSDGSINNKKSVFNFYINISLSITFSFAIFFYYFGNYILILWLGEKFNINELINSFIILMLITNLNYCFTNMIWANDKVNYISKTIFIFSILYLLIAKFYFIQFEFEVFVLYLSFLEFLLFTPYLIYISYRNFNFVKIRDQLTFLVPIALLIYGLYFNISVIIWIAITIQFVLSTYYFKNANFKRKNI